MFIKKIDKVSKRNGKEYFTYRLVESYRIDGKPRHRTILNLGKLEGIPREYHKLLCDRIEQKIKAVPTPLFDNLPHGIEKAADAIYHQIRKAQLMDYALPKPEAERKEPIDIQAVDINSIENEDSRTLGGEWLSKQMMDECGLTALLTALSKNPRSAQLMQTEIIARMVHPSSERETSRWLSCESALCEMSGIDRVPSHKELYAAARELYSHKKDIESSLYQTMESKFPDIQQLRLFDLTNFYFEGRKEGSEKSQFGRSKEKRSDAKLISLAMLTNGKGFVCRSRFYAGNISEPGTLKEVLGDLEGTKPAKLFESKPIAVMDAGIATKENLEYLKNKEYDYICVSRSSLQDYEVISTKPVKLKDNRDHPIEVQIVTNNKDESDNDLYLYVKSDMKAIKERSMSKKIQARFEQDLQNIKASLSKKHGVKIKDKVNRRIGRILEKYKSIGSRYDITLTTNKKDEVTEMSWVENKEAKPAGVYFIRCSKNKLTEELIWYIYNTLREIESTFRCLKTDLDIRPVYHQNDIDTEAHLFTGILAYQLVHAIRQTLKAKGIRHDWRHIRNIMSAQTLVTTSMNCQNKNRLILRQPTRPNQYTAEIYNAMNYKQAPAKLKTKSVVPHSG